MTQCKTCNHKVKDVVVLGIKMSFAVCDSCSEKAKEQESKERKEKLRQESLATSGIPYNVMKNIPMKPYNEQKNIYKKLSNFDKDTLELPYIWGRNGTGKTLIATNLLVSLISKFDYLFRIKFISMVKLSTMSLKRRDAEIEDITSDKYHAILIDDIGNHNSYDMTLESLRIILDSRLYSYKRTIITSNYKPTDLKNRMLANSNHAVNKNLCNSIVDRVLELCTPMKMDGKSLRIEGAKRRIKEQSQ